jgi:hypothetical protein
MSLIKCDMGNHLFEPASPGQTTCTQCQLRPSDSSKEDREIKIAEKKNKKLTKEQPMAQPNCPSQKICVDCKKPYKPTSNVQKRCLGCKKEHDRNYAKAYAATNGGRDGIRKPASAATKPVMMRRTSITMPTGTVADMLASLLEYGCTGLTFGNISVTINRQ